MENRKATGWRWGPVEEEREAITAQTWLWPAFLHHHLQPECENGESVHKTNPVRLDSIKPSESKYAFLFLNFVKLEKNEV